MQTNWQDRYEVFCHKRILNLSVQEKMMAYKAVLFDYDGTLTDRTKSAYTGFKLVLKQYFPQLDEHDPVFEGMMQQCILWDEYGTIGKKTVMERVKDHWLPDLDVDQAVKQWYEVFPDCQFWTEGMPETIKALKEKYKVGMVTNGPHDRQWPKIHKMHMDDMFDPIIVSGDFGKKKPDPSIYQAAADYLHVSCEECIYVGDTFHTDIVGAINAHMRPVWFCAERAGVSDLDVEIVRSAKELADLLM